VRAREDQPIGEGAGGPVPPPEPARADPMAGELVTDTLLEYDGGEPVSIAGRSIPAVVQVAACLWLAMRREDLCREPPRFAPSAGSSRASPMR
jgi:hypothetical protein